MRASGLDHDHAVVGRPLEEAAQVMAVRLERASAVPSQERRGSQLGIVNRVVGLAVLDGRHGWSSCFIGGSVQPAAQPAIRATGHHCRSLSIWDTALEVPSALIRDQTR